MCMPFAPVTPKPPEPLYPRESAAKRGYGRRWSKASKLFLDRYPFCGSRINDQTPVMSLCHTRYLSGELKHQIKADQVDHVIPHRGDQELFPSSRCHLLMTSARLFIHGPQNRVILVLAHPCHEQTAPCIAGVAGRHKVSKCVVSLVSVQVVRDK